MKFVYVLEMVIQTVDGIVNEPLGIFSEEEDAEKWMLDCQENFKSSTVMFNILPFQMDVKPPLLEMAEGVMDKSVAYQLAELYDKDVFEQMVEEDGTFSYQLKSRYQNYMEKYIAKRFDR